MKTSLLLLTALSIVLLLQASRHTHASELSQLLDKEIRDLKDEIEKRGKQRKPCGFTWFCRRRRRGRGKRVSEISIYLPNVQVGRSSAFIPCYKKHSQSGYRNTFDRITSTLPVMHNAYVALIVLARLYFLWHGFCGIPLNTPLVACISLAYSKFK